MNQELTFRDLGLSEEILKALEKKGSLPSRDDIFTLSTVRVSPDTTYIILSSILPPDIDKFISIAGKESSSSQEANIIGSAKNKNKNLLIVSFNLLVSQHNHKQCSTTKRFKRMVNK